MDRRQFLLASSTMACLCLLGRRPLRAEQAVPIRIGHLSEYAANGAYEKFSAAHGFIVVRARGRLYAMAARCTHRDAPLENIEGRFRCPAHGAAFSMAGTVQRGPARKALPRLHIACEADGMLYVDASRKFDEPQWQEPGAYVDLRAIGGTREGSQDGKDGT